MENKLCQFCEEEKPEFKRILCDCPRCESDFPPWKHREEIQTCEDCWNQLWKIYHEKKLAHERERINYQLTSSTYVPDLFPFNITFYELVMEWVIRRNELEMAEERREHRLHC